MENENDMQIGLLAGKVSQLKQLSIDIGAHVKDDNRMLNDLDGSFDSVRAFLCLSVPFRDSTDRCRLLSVWPRTPVRHCLRAAQTVPLASANLNY